MLFICYVYLFSLFLPNAYSIFILSLKSGKYNLSSRPKLEVSRLIKSRNRELKFISG